MRNSLPWLVGSRFGLRVVSIFVLAALVPLALASAVLIREFSDQLAQREQRDLKALVRGYGMDLVGRLGSADDVLAALAAGAGRRPDPRWLEDELGRLDWVRSVRVLPADGSPSFAGERATLTWEFDPDGLAIFRLTRRLSDRTLLDVELSPDWLWRDIADVTEDATLMVLDPAGRRFIVHGEHAGHVADAELQAFFAGLRDARNRPVDVDTGSGRWAASYWELFLNGRFRSPSWQVIAFKPAASVTASLYSARVAFPAIVILAVLVVCLVSVRLIHRLLKPLGVLVEGTRRIARLEFSDRVELEGSDEFAELARSFNGMSDRLRLQFSALGALSEIDRLLLHSRGLEPILGSVLPRIADVLGCESVTVMLIDADAANHGRAYDYLAHTGQVLPVRRLVTDIAALRAALDGNACLELPADDPRFGVLLAPILQAGASRFQVSSLRHDDEVRGFLCAGFPAPPTDQDSTGPSIGLGDFADRLSVVLANLARAEKLFDQAHYDPLTHLANRQHFREVLAQCLSRSEGAEAHGALLYIDLDHFKRVNDTAGHTAGDELLCAVARRLESCFDAGDLVARLGGDEFAAIVRHVRNADSAHQSAQRILGALHAPVTVAGREYRIEASIGITLFPSDGDTIEVLLKNSDMAMYRAKECGRGRAVFFETEMQDRMQARAALESGLHHALEHEEFKLLFQPIVACKGRGSRGVEALIRWPTAPGGEPLSPAVFMPLAEESDLITGVGGWVLRTACREFASWKLKSAHVDYVSVNVSARQLRDPGFVAVVSTCLATTRMQPGELHLEITEGVLADGPSVAHALDELASLGVHLALDDFGTGYSSLSYLRRFPIHSVKIDQSFITEIPTSDAACRLVESIIAMANALGKHVVAEGVETESQLRFLESAGCGSIQGFLYGRPMDAAGIPAHFRRFSASPQVVHATRTARRKAAR